MENKLVIISIIGAIIVIGIILSTVNKKNIKNILKNKNSNCSNDNSNNENIIMGYDRASKPHANLPSNLVEEYANLRRLENREKTQEDPSATNRSDICTTDSCNNCDPYNKQLQLLCKECNNN